MTDEMLNAENIFKTAKERTGLENNNKDFVNAITELKWNYTAKDLD